MRLRRHIGSGSTSASARRAVISLTTKIACSLSSAKERRSPVSSRRRMSARRPLVRPVASRMAPLSARTAIWNGSPWRRSRSAAVSSAAALSGESQESKSAKAARSAGAPTRSGRPPSTCGGVTEVSQMRVRWSSASRSAVARSSCTRNAAISSCAALPAAPLRLRASIATATTAQTVVPAVTAIQATARRASPMPPCVRSARPPAAKPVPGHATSAPARTAARQMNRRGPEVLSALSIAIRPAASGPRTSRPDESSDLTRSR